MKDADLRILKSADWIKANNIEEITERQLVDCIKKRYLRKIGGKNVYPLVQYVGSVVIKMHIFEAQDRLRTLDQGYHFISRRGVFWKPQRIIVSYCNTTYFGQIKAALPVCSNKEYNLTA